MYVTILPETSKIAAGIEKALRDVDVKAVARKWREQIEKELKDVDVEVKVKVDPRKAKKEIEDAAKDQTATITADAETGAAETQLDATARPRKAKIIAEVDQASVARANAKIGKGFGGGGIGIPNTGISIPVPIAIEAIGLTPNIVPLIGSMVQGVGQLAGAINLLPAVAGAAGLAIGSLKIGMSGFSDAIKEIGDPEKFAEAIKALSPAAQDAALAIQGLMPQITQLKMTVQDALFTGMGEQFGKLGDTYLPIFTDIMSRMASSAGTAFKGISEQLQTPEMQEDIKTFGTNAAQAFSTLSQAAQPFITALGDIMAVGGTFLPELAGTVNDLAIKFRDFIGEARDSGQIAGWIRGAIEAFTDLKDIAFNTWNIFKGIFQAADGGDFLNTVVNLTTMWSNWINSIEGQNALRNFFDEAKQTLQDIWPIIRDLGISLYNAFLGAKAVIDEILPMLQSISNYLAKHEELVFAIGVAFASWKLALIVQDIAKIGAALLGLQATAATAGAGIRTGIAAGLTLGGALSLPITLTIAGSALAIWAGEKLLAAGKSITLPVGDVGVPQPIVSDNASVTKIRPGAQVQRKGGTTTNIFDQGGLYPNVPANAPPPPSPHPGLAPAVPRTPTSPNALPNVSQQPAPPISGYRPPAPSSGGGGAGGGAAAPEPKPVAPPGMSFSYGGFGELNWEALAEAESGGNWEMNSGNGYFGGLQFLQSTWEAYGGPPGTTADQFSKSDQIKVATALYNDQGTAPWPANGWLLTATPDQLNAAGLTAAGNARSSSRRGHAVMAPGFQPLSMGPGGIPMVASGTSFGAAGSQQPAWATAGAISQLFPGIKRIGGQRPRQPDALPPRG